MLPGGHSMAPRLTLGMSASAICGANNLQLHLESSCAKPRSYNCLRSWLATRSHIWAYAAGSECRITIPTSGAEHAGWVPFFDRFLWFSMHLRGFPPFWAFEGPCQNTRGWKWPKRCLGPNASILGSPPPPFGSFEVRCQTRKAPCKHSEVKCGSWCCGVGRPKLFCTFSSGGGEAKRCQRGIWIVLNHVWFLPWLCAFFVPPNQESPQPLPVQGAGGRRFDFPWQPRMTPKLLGCDGHKGGVTS